MSEMIERVARRIAEHETGSVLNWRTFEGTAIAAIEAMREPTEAMIEAGFRAPERGMNMGQHAAATWDAMISASLQTDNKV